MLGIFRAETTAPENAEDAWHLITGVETCSLWVEVYSQILAAILLNQACPWFSLSSGKINFGEE